MYMRLSHDYFLIEWDRKCLADKKKLVDAFDPAMRYVQKSIFAFFVIIYFIASCGFFCILLK